MTRRAADHRRSYPYFTEITTRWMDNDTYAHVNNVVYYSYFDTAVNRFLIERGLLDLTGSAVVGLVVETQCQFFRPLSFPDLVHVGMRVASLGTSSVRYEIAVFANADEQAAAQGHFVHVYVDRASGKAVPVPAAVRAGLAPLMLPGD